MSEQSVIGVYDTMSKAEAAIYKLDLGDFPLRLVSVVAQNLQEEGELNGYIAVAPERASQQAEPAARPWATGLFRLLHGAAFIWGPIFGPLLVAGPLAAPLKLGLEKTKARTAAEGLLDSLSGWGVPMRRILKYEEDLKAHRVVVVAHGRDPHRSKAWEIMRRTDPRSLDLFERDFGLARFVARDPDAPAASANELQGLIPKMRGVIDWMIHPNGDVTVEYDHDEITYDAIEMALEGLGFKVIHVSDNPDVSPAEMKEALSAEGTPGLETERDQV